MSMNVRVLHRGCYRVINRTLQGEAHWPTWKPVRHSSSAGISVTPTW